MAAVSRLRVAPVKGLATVLRERITVDERGAVEDRRLLLLDEAGDVVTLRTAPELVQVAPDLDLDRGSLCVTGPDGTTATSSLDDVGAPAASRLFGKDRTGRLLRGAVPAALSAVAGRPIRVLLAERGDGWDEGPVSILGRASATAVGGPDQDTARYRMLVELDGTAPYEEDTWVGRRVAIGTSLLRVLGPLPRCVVITRSPRTGAPDWDGLRVLAEERGRDQLCLGVTAEVLRPGEIAVGDEVDVRR